MIHCWVENIWSQATYGKVCYCCCLFWKVKLASFRSDRQKKMRVWKSHNKVHTQRERQWETETYKKSLNYKSRLKWTPRYRWITQSTTHSIKTGTIEKRSHVNESLAQILSTHIHTYSHVYRVITKTIKSAQKNSFIFFCGLQRNIAQSILWSRVHALHI